MKKFLCILLALCLMAGQNRRPSGGVTSLLDAPRALFSLGFGRMGAAGRGLKEAGKHAGKFGKQTGAVAAGLAVAVPVVAVMVTLLMRADAAFEGLLDKLPEADWEEYFFAVLFGTFSAWVLYARGAALRHKPKEEQPVKAGKGMHPLTVNTVLIAACFVYGVYLVSQLAYLSGGFAGLNWLWILLLTFAGCFLTLLILAIVPLLVILFSFFQRFFSVVQSLLCILLRLNGIVKGLIGFFYSLSQF